VSRILIKDKGYLEYIPKLLLLI